MYSPEPTLVSEIKAYDDKLRIRWGRHTEKWIIERYHPSPDPRFANATPPKDTASATAKDLYEGWREGYVHVLTVARDMCHWQFIAPELARMDAWRQGGMKEVNRQLDQDNEDWDKATDKNIDNWAENATDDAYEMMAWRDGRRIAVTNPEPQYVDTGLGFKVVDRRRRA